MIRVGCRREKSVSRNGGGRGSNQGWRGRRYVGPEYWLVLFSSNISCAAAKELTRIVSFYLIKRFFISGVSIL